MTLAEHNINRFILYHSFSNNKMDRERREQQERMDREMEERRKRDEEIERLREVSQSAAAAADGNNTQIFSYLGRSPF